MQIAKLATKIAFLFLQIFGPEKLQVSLSLSLSLSLSVSSSPQWKNLENHCETPVEKEETMKLWKQAEKDQKLQAIIVVRS